jgi:long-chain acyl-CoA synthetase
LDKSIWQQHYDYSVPFTIRYPRIAIHDVLQIPANAYPDKTAIVFEGRKITFWELRQHALRMSNAFAALGVEKGDRVGIHLPTCPQYLISFYAVMSLGAIVVNLNPLYTVEELKATAHATDISLLVTSDMSVENARILVKVAGIRGMVVTRIDDYGCGGTRVNPVPLELEEGWHMFSKLLDSSKSAIKPRTEVTSDDVAVIQFTGGTTGIPKGAMLTHGNLIAAVLQYTAWMSPILQLLPPERRSVLMVLPLYHVYGNVLAHWAIYNCAMQIMVPRFQIDELVDLMGTFKEISFFPTVATVVSALLTHPRIDELDLGKKLTYLNSGGGPTALSLIEQIEDMGIYYGQGWGMSETAALGTNNPVFGIKKINSIGIPYPDTDVRIVDLTEGIHDVPLGEPGEIIIKGATVMKGYWNNPEETAGQMKDGWLSTGDIAVQDEDGFIYIVDRKKDMIISGGFNIYPREVDEVIFQHPKVAFAVSVGIPDAYRGETVKAFIVLKKGETATEKEIIEFCRGKLAPYKVPRRIEFREELPQSSVGKVLRKVLRAEEEAKYTEKSE